MGKLVGIFGSSGDGKTTSTIVNPDGTVDFSKEGYKGMDPRTHVIINLDKKALPFPGNLWSKENKNYFEVESFTDIKKIVEQAAKNPTIKSLSFDTLNIYLALKEFNDRRKMTYDQWRDVANDIIELTTLCNTVLRDDQIAYVFGHTELVTDIDGREVKALSVIGKKSKRTPPEGFFPICLFTQVDDEGDGTLDFGFETRKNRSSAKTPIGMFKDFRIPNSLKLVDDTIRDYYKIK